MASRSTALAAGPVPEIVAVDAQLDRKIGMSKLMLHFGDHGTRGDQRRGATVVLRKDTSRLETRGILTDFKEANVDDRGPHA